MVKCSFFVVNSGKYSRAFCEFWIINTWMTELTLAQARVYENIFTLYLSEYISQYLQILNCHSSYCQALASVLQPTASNCCCFDTVYIVFWFADSKSPEYKSTICMIWWRIAPFNFINLPQWYFIPVRQFIERFIYILFLCYWANIVFYWIYYMFDGGNKYAPVTQTAGDP